MRTLNIPSSHTSTWTVLPLASLIVVIAGRLSEPGRVHSRFASLAAAEYGLSSAAAPACLELFESIAFDFIDEFPSALGHDTPVLQDMDNIRLDIFQKFLIMSDNDG